MKGILLFATLLFVIQAFAQSSSEVNIMALSNKKFKWMTEGKIDSLANLFDEKMSLVHASGRIQTKSEYLNTLRSGQLTYNSINVQDSSVRIVGTTAVIVGKCIFNITVNGNKLSFDYAYTEVYSKQENQWKMILYEVRNTKQ